MKSRKPVTRQLIHKVHLGWGYAVCGEKYNHSQSADDIGDNGRFSLYWTKTNCTTCLIIGIMRMINEKGLPIIEGATE